VNRASRLHTPAARDRLCLALDLDSGDEAVKLAERVSPYVGLFKVGFQLFVSEGPSVLRRLGEAGGKVFLDLKFHDIPNTVGSAVRSATRLGASIINVHAYGGSRMIEAAVRAARQAEQSEGHRVLVLAVTVLTSLDEADLRRELRVEVPLGQYVVGLAQLAQSSGADGVIASPREVRAIRDACGGDFVIGTPGIRMPEAPPDDQRRTMTPAEAVAAGADFIVVGRPIVQAADPAAAARAMLEYVGG